MRDPFTCISLFPEAFCSASCMESAHEIFTEMSATEMNLLIVKLPVEPTLGVGGRGSVCHHADTHFS